MSPSALELRSVRLLNGVVLCAEDGERLIVGEIAGNAALLADLLDYASERGCTSVVFNTSRKGILIKALEATNARHYWGPPGVIGYWMEIKREDA